jgi:hypothetical protein
MFGCDVHDRSMLDRFAVDESEPQQKSFLNDADGRTDAAGSRAGVCAGVQ